MSKLYTQTLKYFYLAISEFIPYLKELQHEVKDEAVKDELGNIIEAYTDISSKISKHGLNFDDPNQCYDGEPKELDLGISEKMVENLARLSSRLLLTWKERLEKLRKKEYLTEKNEEDLQNLENLIGPLDALVKTESYVLWKYAHMGPLKFPGEFSKEENNFIDKLNLLLNEIINCYLLGDQELLESKKLEDLESKVRTNLGQIILELPDEVTKLKYKKLNSGWRNVLKSGFHNRKTAEGKLEDWRVFIKEIIENISDYKPRSEVYFSAGQSFDAVKVLREILKSAKTKIWIEDNFLHPDTVRIIEPYTTTGALEIRFLTRDSGRNKNFNSFRIDMHKLKSQYPSSNIETRENSHCHDRYIIIDEKDIYHSGQSFHDLGGKASQINKVEDELNKSKILDDFKDWWNTGNII